MAATHTGALASEDDVADEFLRDCGIARARTLGGMLASLDLVKQVPAQQRGQRPRVGVVTTTGGGAALIVDELSLRGIDVVKASADTLKQLADTGAPAAPGPVIDVTLAGANPVVMSAVLDVLLKAPEFDIVMCVVGSSARLQPHLVVAPIIEIAAKGHLLPTFVVPEAPEAIAALRAAGVPAFATPEVCADAIATALTRIVPADRGIHIVDDHVATRHLDEVEGYVVLARAGIPSAAHQVVDLAELAAGAVDIQVAFPVVVKALAAELLHKSDVGAVVLNVDSMDGVRAAAAAIRKSVHEHRPDIDLTRVMVQTMTSDAAGSVLVSYRRDVHVGPMVLLSVGGTLTELWNCRSIRMAPVSRAEARDMIEEIPALRVLTGYRGAPPADVDALCAAIEGLSQFAHDLQVLSVEVNPVLVGRAGAGAWAVDAVVDVAAEHP
jgi:acetate---CoA ligase (ADP-forming)